MSRANATSVQSRPPKLITLINVTSRPSTRIGVFIAFWWMLLIPFYSSWTRFPPMNFHQQNFHDSLRCQLNKFEFFISFWGFLMTCLITLIPSPISIWCWIDALFACSVNIGQRFIAFEAMFVQIIWLIVGLITFLSCFSHQDGQTGCF